MLAPDAHQPLQRVRIGPIASVQQFGVWGAGSANDPGNKDGWSVEKPGWIVDSVGFAGPDAEYTLTLMNSLEGEGD